jgi:putative transcriptional regulator
MATEKRKRRILDARHETALGLHRAGLISKRRMGEIEALRHLDVHAMPPRKIRSLREDARVSQAVFAAALNTSAATVRKREAGDKKPSGPALKLPNLIERKGLEAVSKRFPASHYSRPGATAPPHHLCRHQGIPIPPSTVKKTPKKPGGPARITRRFAARPPGRWPSAAVLSLR